MNAIVQQRRKAERQIQKANAKLMAARCRLMDLQQHPEPQHQLHPQGQALGLTPQLGHAGPQQQPYVHPQQQPNSYPPGQGYGFAPQLQPMPQYPHYPAPPPAPAPPPQFFPGYGGYYPPPGPYMAPYPYGPMGPGSAPPYQQMPPPPVSVPVVEDQKQKKKKKKKKTSVEPRTPLQNLQPNARTAASDRLLGRTAPKDLFKGAEDDSINIDDSQYVYSIQRKRKVSTPVDYEDERLVKSVKSTRRAPLPLPSSQTEAAVDWRLHSDTQVADPNPAVEKFSSPHSSAELVQDDFEDLPESRPQHLSSESTSLSSESNVSVNHQPSAHPKGPKKVHATLQRDTGGPSRRTRSQTTQASVDPSQPLAFNYAFDEQDNTYDIEKAESESDTTSVVCLGSQLIDEDEDEARDDADAPTSVPYYLDEKDEDVDEEDEDSGPDEPEAEGPNKRDLSKVFTCFCCEETAHFHFDSIKELDTHMRLDHAKGINHSSQTSKTFLATSTMDKIYEAGWPMTEKVWVEKSKMFERGGWEAVVQDTKKRPILEPLQKAKVRKNSRKKPTRRMMIRDFSQTDKWHFHRAMFYDKNWIATTLVPKMLSILEHFDERFKTDPEWRDWKVGTGEKPPFMVNSDEKTICWLWDVASPPWKANHPMSYQITYKPPGWKKPFAIRHSIRVFMMLALGEVTLSQWMDCARRKIEVSHLCANSNCLTPGHSIPENHFTNIDRRECVRSPDKSMDEEWCKRHAYTGHRCRSYMNRFDLFSVEQLTGQPAEVPHMRKTKKAYKSFDVDDNEGDPVKCGHPRCRFKTKDGRKLRAHWYQVHSQPGKFNKECSEFNINQWSASTEVDGWEIAVHQDRPRTRTDSEPKKTRAAAGRVVKKLLSFF